ncbi:MAG: hypothetical protein Hyperionvirus3_17 [Hyperionvirus sp.]|uniref:Uncharacterized protein n=1 Tax=Hyperionvirus sp. TaxID=2487770 RepID=A0A3G5A9K7_9VIRU|nr:MAG: hypothetical protein Hyperionvirus3_17 [Hyperionvirus sp.]
MIRSSIDFAFDLGLQVESICELGSITETDPSLSFDRIPTHFEYIAQSLKWQATNIISEEFLSNEVCYFLVTDAGIYFFLGSHNSEKPDTRFAYVMSSRFYSGIFNHQVCLSGPQDIEISIIKKQLKSYGFILWPAFDNRHRFGSAELKYGTFRNFYPEIKINLIECDSRLRCEHNTKKGIKYLKLLHRSYVERLSKVIDVVPDVLLDIISYYVLGEFIFKKLYW